MRADVQAIFKNTPIEKQVMMFSATLPKDIREVCRKFMKNPFEVLVDNENKLTLEGLQQYYVDLKENEKIKEELSKLKMNNNFEFIENQGILKDLLIENIKIVQIIHIFSFCCFMLLLTSLSNQRRKKTYTNG